MAEVTSDQIADYIIRFSHDHGDPITNLKLQKLLYYAQAWYLALHGKPLFDEDFEAWVHGPVLPSIYQKYKKFSWQPIVENPRTMKLPAHIKAHLLEVMSVYGGLSAWDLERTTHQEDPWLKARGNKEKDERSGQKIKMDDMKRFYRGMASENSTKSAQPRRR